jgi:WD40 repeat protein
MFVPFSSNLLTASSDKSITLWDTRTGLSVNTIYGHNNSVNCVVMPLKVRTRLGCRSVKLTLSRVILSGRVMLTEWSSYGI